VKKGGRISWLVRVMDCMPLGSLDPEGKVGRDCVLGGA